MGHIAHLRKQFKSINTYDYIITLIKRRKKTIINFMRIYFFFIWINLNPLHPRMLCAKFGWNWPSGSGEEDENVKSLRQRRQQQRRQRQRRRTTDKFWSEKLTWAFGSGELKRSAGFEVHCILVPLVTLSSLLLFEHKGNLIWKNWINSETITDNNPVHSIVQIYQQYFVTLFLNKLKLQRKQFPVAPSWF